jgi:superfamily II DNA/RNA helicase
LSTGGGGAARGRAVGLPSTLRVSVLTCDEDNVATALQQALRLGQAPASATAAPADTSSPAAPATLVFVPEGRAVAAELRLLQQTGLPQAESLASFLARGGALPRRPPRGAETANAATGAADRAQAGAAAGGAAAGPVIVASQSTARGLDLPGVGLVIIVGFPSSADALLHLAGRTARQGAQGRVVLIATERECDIRLGYLSAQLGFDLKADVARVAGRDEGWANVWRVHQRVTQADQKYR